MNKPRVLGIIPARGGSKGVPGKNIRDVYGKPLIAHTIQAGVSASVVNSVVVSTDDEDIAQVAKKYGARVPFMRPSELATDEAPTAPVITHTLERLENGGEEYETFVLLQPTSPLRTKEHIEEAYSIYQDSDYDSVISVYPTHNTRWKRTPDGVKKINYTDTAKRRQDRDPEYVTNGAIYITNVDQFLQAGKIIAGKTELYEMNEIDSVDIDTSFDLWLAQNIFEHKKS